jgi:signal peptide peptidase SppA
MNRLTELGVDLWAMRAERFAHLMTAEAQERSETRQGRLPKVDGAVAVLPLYGVISQRGHEWWADTSADRFGAVFDSAMRNPGIGAVVIEVDSPGGTVYGVRELADRVYASRGVKPVVAVANSEAASAAFWVASQAEQFVVTPGGAVGSIGVWAAHEDWSQFEERVGVKTTLISAGKFKVEGHPYGPLDEEARAEMQRGVDQTYSSFVSAVSRGRGASVETVRGGFGEGRMVRAQTAQAQGMVDRVATLDRVLSELGVRRSDSPRARAEDKRLTEELMAEAEQFVLAENVKELVVESSSTDTAWIISGGDPEVLRKKLDLKYGDAV